MDKQKQQLNQQQDALLEQMGQIRVMCRGTLSAQEYPARRARKDGQGAAGPYYLWQGFIDGKHFSRRVSAQEAQRLKEGIEARHHFEQLSGQYVELGEALSEAVRRNGELAQTLKKGLKSRPNKDGR
jgi:hypothetical protein